MAASAHRRNHNRRIAVAAEGTEAARQISSSLRKSGYCVQPIPFSAPSAVRHLLDLRPEAVIVRAAPRSLAAAGEVCRVAAGRGMAVVLLTPAVTQAALQAARDTGAMLHLVEPVTAHTLAAAVDVARARGRELELLRAQLANLRESAKVRQVVERAKRVLMRRLALTEEEAHRRLQLESRNRNRRLIETAWQVVNADAALSRVAAHASPASRR